MNCSVCGKKMPSNILEKHIQKRHGTAQETLTAEEVAQETSNTEKPKWDYGEINTCSQCHEEWPSKFMEFHMSIRHGL